MPTQEQIARDLSLAVVEKLKSTSDELQIKEVVTKAWEQLKNKVENKDSFRRARKIFRDGIKEAFPLKLIEKGYDPTKQPEAAYYYTESKEDGKAAPRWEHLALWYATTNEGRWEDVGDEARVRYFSQWEEKYSEHFKKWKESVLGNRREQAEQPVKQVQVNQVSEPEQLESTPKLEDMTLEQMELDAETQQIVGNALNHSGMSLADFIKQACTVYAKTVMGKAKQSGDDLSTVPTEELLNVSQMVDGKEVRSKYFTHPGRAEELTRRAIEAIKRHNTNAPEKTQRWAITQTAIQFLTGSRPATIKEILKQYQTDIEDHHRSYELSTFNEIKNEYVLDPMINRKGKDIKIEKEIDFIGLVPDGL